MKTKMAEVFAYAVTNNATEVWGHRNDAVCPYKQHMDGTCAKESKEKPVGICSVGTGTHARVVCPYRFNEGHQPLADAARLAFGEGKPFTAVHEVPILRAKRKAKGKARGKLAKVDWMIACLDESGEVEDFAAIEYQAAYVSGRSVKPSYWHYMGTHQLSEDEPERSVDYRSSAQKRLVPQLEQKLPVFRRWGKSVFVVVDIGFLDHLGEFEEEASFENSELTWLAYDLVFETDAYRLKHVATKFTTWDTVRYRLLSEGEAPPRNEVEMDIASKARRTGIDLHS